MPVFPQAGLALALFLASAVGLVLEIVAARLIAPYVGMSLYTWTAIIATVLAGMSAGHWLGGRLSETADSKALARIAVLFATAAVNVLAIPVLLRWAAPRLLAGAEADIGGQIEAVTLLSLVLFFMPSLLIAASSPILTRIAIDLSPTRRGAALGRMFAAGALGAILGTVATGFVFISWIGSQGTLIAVAVTLCLLGVLCAAAARIRVLTVAMIVFLAVLAVSAYLMRNTLLASACTVESDYFCIRVVDYPGLDRDRTRLMVLDHMGHGINSENAPRLLHSSYVDLTDRIADMRFGGRKGIRTFFIGGGAYTLPRAWAEKYPEGEHWVAEIDPEVTKAAAERMWVSTGAPIRPVHADARWLLQSLAEGTKFDIIIGDAFKDLAVPQHLVTLEFSREIARRLTGDGFYALTVIDGRREPKFLLAMHRTLKEAFPAVQIWADVEQLVEGGRLTYILTASRRAIAQPRILSVRFPGRHWVEVPPDQIAGKLSPADYPVLTDDFAPVDRLIGTVAAQSR